MMLKHVAFRSTSSLGRVPSDLTCRGSCSVSPDHHHHHHHHLNCSPELALKSSTSNLLSSDTISYKDDTLSLKGDLPSRGSSSYASHDTISLHSTLSFSSLATGRLSSRCSSTTSLDDHHPTVPVKIYLRSLRPDMEYKTVRLSSEATCRQLVMMLLAKFRLRHRDPNLFFVTMEVVVRAPGGGAPARRLLVLEDHARPAELQQCRPRGEARFSVGVKRGGLLRVHDSVLMAGSQYKSLLVSYRTTATDVVQLLLNCYNNKDSPSHYALHELNKNPYSDRRLRQEECPLQVQSEWPKNGRSNLSFVLRRDLTYTLALTSRLSWRRSLDQSSTDTESEHEEHNTTLASLASALSTSSHGSLSSSASVASSASMTSDASTSSSSGVSSSSSPLASPSPSPAKTKSLSSLVQSLEARVTSKPPIYCSPYRPVRPTSLAVTPALSLPPSSSTPPLPTPSSLPLHTSSSLPLSPSSLPTPSSLPLHASSRVPLSASSSLPLPTSSPLPLPLPARTTSLPPTPVPRTILSTTSTTSTNSSSSTSTLKSKSLPALRCPEVELEGQCCTSSNTIFSYSLKTSSPSTSSLLSSSTTPTSLSPTTSTYTTTSGSSPSPSIVTLSPSTTSLSHSTSTVSLESTSTTTNNNTSSSSSSLCPSTCTSTSSLSHSTSTVSLASCSSSPVTSTPVSSPTIPSKDVSGPPPPPLPARRSSCCRHYENCFYI